MKIAIASKGKELSSQVDERFGRAEFFIITDKKGETIEEVIKNDSKNNSTGAGTSAASLIAEKQVSLLLAGNLGPKAQAVIDAAGIKFINFEGKVSDALISVREKELDPLKAQSLPEYSASQTISRERRRAGSGRGMGNGKGRCRNRGKEMAMEANQCRCNGSRGTGKNGSWRF